MFRFENKTYLVTGANSGIGKCVSKLLLEDGARLFMIDRDVDIIEGMLHAFPTKVSFLQFDLNHPEGVGVIFNKAKELINEVITSDESVLQEKSIDIMMESWEASSIKISARFYVKNADFRVTKCRVLENIKNSFDANNIEIPFTQVVVHNSKD